MSRQTGARVGWARSVRWMVCAASGLLSAYGQTTAQQKPLMAEDVFKNIQVLKGLTVDQFMDTMGFFTSALGYNCTNCHGDDVVGNWAKYANDPAEKRTARRMIQLVGTINTTLFQGRQAITCYTCHRGSPSPKTTPSLLEQYSEPPPDDPNEVETNPRAPATPSAGEILDRYIEVIGGSQRLAALTSYIEKGSYEGFDTYHGSVPVEVYARNAGQRSVIVHTQNGNSVTTFDGKNAWIMGPDKPVSVLELPAGGDFDGVKLDASIAFPGGLKQALSDLRTGFPTTLIDGRRVLVIQATSGGSRVKLFFDRQSGLLTRLVRYSKTVIGPVPTQIDYSDYRDVDGVKLPFQWKITWTGGQSTYSVDNVQPNAQIDSAKFAKPVAPASPVVAPAKITQ